LKICSSVVEKPNAGEKNFLVQRSIMVGNRVFGHSLILCIASALVMTPWGTLGADLVFGWQGHIAIGKVPVFYWAICLCLILGSITSILNYLGLTNLSSVLMFGLFGFATACSLVAAFQHLVFGTVGTGSVLAIILGLFGVAISPADKPVAQRAAEPRGKKSQDAESFEYPERKKKLAA
jgi:hypothetical protein